MLPVAGSVLGVDVGGSLTRRSTAVCRLSWTPDAITWTISRSTAEPVSRAANIARVVAGQDILVAAFDGPLAAGLTEINRYRAAERMLTRRLARRIGKPGTSNVPVGRELNAQANACAKDVIALGLLRPAVHSEAIAESAIVEAFPSSYMGLLLVDPATFATIRRDRSDRYFVHLADNGRILALLAALLPGRGLASSPKRYSITTIEVLSSARLAPSVLPQGTIVLWAARTVGLFCHHFGLFPRGLRPSSGLTKSRILMVSL